MMPEWRMVTLASTCRKPMYGLIASATDQLVGPPFVRQTDIVTGEIDWKSVPYCVASNDELQKYGLREGDLLISRLGAGVGTAAHVREPHGAVFAGYLVRFQADPEVLDHRFAGYMLHSDAWLQHVKRVRSGAAQPTLNAQQMGQFQFRLPPLEEQRRIADVLGALDELIDTNRSLIDALIRQADSVAGAFPVEGEWMTFGEVCDVFGGATPKTSEPSYWNGELSWATPSDITALRSPYLFATSRQITQSGLDACSSDLHPPGAILMTSRATIGAFALAQVPAATNQGFIVVEPRRPEDRYFLFHEMRRRVPEFMDRANGSTFMEISRGTFKSLPVDLPSERDRDELARKVEPLHEAAVELEREAAELELCRDELLPLLLSGRVRVDKVAA